MAPSSTMLVGSDFCNATTVLRINVHRYLVVVCHGIS